MPFAAADAWDALDQFRKLVGDDELAMQGLKHVVAGRLFRKLCDATKMPFTPDERMLKQLGLPPGKVAELYRPQIGPLRDARGNEIPDNFCFGLGYRGRVGCYEVITVDDELKQAVQSNASTTVRRQIFRKQKGRYIQEVAAVRVANGETSVEEFVRVLRMSSDSANPSATSRPATKV